MAWNPYTWIESNTYRCSKYILSVKYLCQSSADSGRFEVLLSHDEPPQHVGVDEIGRNSSQLHIARRPGRVFAQLDAYCRIRSEGNCKSPDGSSQLQADTRTPRKSYVGVQDIPCALA